MKVDKINASMRIVELAWMAVAAVSVVEIYMRWNNQDTKFWLFVLALCVSVFMYIFRKKQRINYIRRKQEQQ